MIDKSVILDNYSFIENRRVTKKISYKDWSKILTDGDVPLKGKFYGKDSLLSLLPNFSSRNYKGSPRLLLHPFITTELPDEHALAVYIDLSRYTIIDGVIVAPDTTYEAPIYIMLE